jgi:glycosidase
VATKRTTAALEEEEEPEEVLEVVMKRVSFPHTTRVTFQVQAGEDLPFGHFIVVVGSSDALGNWQPQNGIPLEYIEGEHNMWQGTCQLPGYELAEYKYVVRTGWAPDAECWWQGGPNNMLGTNASSFIEVKDQWHHCHEAHHHCEGLTYASQQAVGTFNEKYPQYALPPPEPKEKPKPAKKKRGRPAKAKKVEVVEVEEPPKPEHTVWEHDEVPRWAIEGTIYQIYPLGFCDAPAVNDHTGKVVPRLEKLREYYDYLQDMGVTIVQFSPLFESDTHGYDTTDYFQIDRRLGDVKLMRKIVAELKERGIRVVLDGVFNHTGPNHEAFKSLQKEGVRSRFARWYKLAAREGDLAGWCESNEGGSFAYDCWEGHVQLPTLDLTNHEVKQHVFDVARFWLNDVGVDGWRLDVAYEVSADFWREFRNVCKECKPDSWSIGEIIHQNYNTIVGPGMLGSATNYQTSKAIWSALVDVNYWELASSMQREQALYSKLPLLNFLGNHDVSRICSQLHHREHYLHATAYLMLCRGVPSVYYGDELAMEGRPGEGTCEHSGGDDAVRRPMPNVERIMAASAAENMGGVPWTLQVTRELIALRASYPELFIDGEQDAYQLEYNNTRFAFVRSNGDARAVICFNAAEWDEHEWRLEGIKGQLRPGQKFVDDLEVPPMHPGQQGQGQGDALYQTTVGGDGVLIVGVPARSVRVLIDVQSAGLE